MLNLQQAKHLVVLGGGTAGWFAALTLRRMFSPAVTVQVIESPDIGIVGVGEGGLLNLVQALQHNNINIDDFVEKTGAAFKWGFAYEGWRTGADNDVFYHLFADGKTQESSWMERGFFPLLSALIAQGVNLSATIPALRPILMQASQQEAKTILDAGHSGINPSYHFDSDRVAKYLQDIAVSRGVIHTQGKVTDIVLDEKGHATGVVLDQIETPLPADFLIDASGFSRVVIGKKLATPWRSFKEVLILDRAIPFHMPHPKDNPYLVTRAMAMNAGWMWQIPLQHRVGAGYVFSSAHITEDAALQEIETKLGFAVEPMRTLKFEAGHFEKVWQGNMMALGLASGFVEPLEATSIGQMLEQLRAFEQLVRSSLSVISDFAIDGFNQANASCWQGIRDFLRMHYDTPRNDTPFWQTIRQLPYPESYRALKECWQVRTPRIFDVSQYVTHGWHGIFHAQNWMFVGAPLGVIPPNAGVTELLSLSMPARERIVEYLKLNGLATNPIQPQAKQAQVQQPEV